MITKKWDSRCTEGDKHEQRGKKHPHRKSNSGRKGEGGAGGGEGQGKGGEVTAAVGHVKCSGPQRSGHGKMAAESRPQSWLAGWGLKQKILLKK